MTSSASRLLPHESVGLRNVPGKGRLAGEQRLWQHGVPKLTHRKFRAAAAARRRLRRTKLMFRINTKVTKASIVNT